MRTRARALPTSSRRWVALTAFVLVTFIVVWASVRNAAIRIWAEARPGVAAKFLPASGHAEASEALNRVVEANGSVDAVALTMARDALRREPLDATPVIIAALGASSQGDDANARRLFLEAEIRDPRAIIARYWLFDDGIRNGNYAKALAEGGPLMQLQPEAQSGVLTLFTALADVPAAQSALIAAMRAQPVWRTNFIRTLAASGNPLTLAHAQALLRTAPAPDAGSARIEQAAIVGGLARAGQYAQARALWQTLLPSETAAPMEQVFDQDFEDAQSPPPFAWSIPAIDQGEAQRVALAPNRHVLEVDFTGDRTLLVARQTVMPPSGGYRLSFFARKLAAGSSSDAAPNAGIRCLPAGTNLAQAMFDAVGETMSPQSLNVDIPATCAAVEVRLWVTPGISPGQMQVQISNVRLDRR